MKKRVVDWSLPAVAVSFALGVIAGSVSESLLPGIIALVLSVIALFFLRSRRFLCFLLIAACFGFLRAVPAWHAPLPEEDLYNITGIITDEVRTGDNGQVKTLLSHVTLNGRPYTSGAYWSFYPDECPEDLIPGAGIRVRASLYHPSGPRNPGGYDFREDLLRRGARIGLYGGTDLVIMDAPFTLDGWTASLRHRIRKALEITMGPEYGGYAATMLLGYRGLLSENDRQAFSQLGIAHILAVSGFHVGILVIALSFILGLFHASPRIRLSVTLAVLTFYCLLTGMSPSVIRACLLAVLQAVGKLLKRPRSGIHMLSFAFLAILLVNPVQLTGAGFQLSFSAVLGLILVSPKLRSVFSSGGSHRKTIAGKAADGFCAGFGAQLGCLLPQLYWFQELPLLGLFCNIPMIFLSSVLILLYWITVIFLPVPGLSSFLGSVSSLLTSGLVRVVRQLSLIPGVTLWICQPNPVTLVGWILLLACGCCLFRISAKKRLLLGSVGVMITALSLVPWPHRTTEYIQFSVGNADAAILWDQDTVTVIDTGTNGSDLSGFLHRHRLSVDRLILTHLHADHALGVTDLLKDGIPVKELCLPDGVWMNGVDPKVQEVIRALSTAPTCLASGSVIDLPSGMIRILWPEPGKTRYSGDPNHWSLVMMIDLKGTRLLQAGDLDGRYEMYAAEPADLLKIAHHGSSSSSGEVFMAKANPRVMILSCNSAKRHIDTAARFPDRVLYSTAVNGAVTIRFLDDGYEIIPMYPEERGDDLDT